MGSVPQGGQCQNAEGDAISSPGPLGRGTGERQKRSRSLGRKRMDTVKRCDPMRSQVQTANDLKPSKTSFNRAVSDLPRSSF